MNAQHIRTAHHIRLNGVSKAAVLAALYNASQAPVRNFGRHWMSDDERQPLTVIDAERLLGRQQRFDYLNGRPLKVDLSGETLDPTLYDRDHGAGRARLAIAHLIPANA